MPASQALLNTRVDDRFVLEYIAGTGGMGAVYRARDERSGRAVAIKLLQQSGGTEQLERFTREANVLAELDHPGIVQHVAHGVTASGEPYLAMEWLEGEDLAQRLARGPLSLSETLTLVRCVAEALAYAHARGIVHRDVKPSNVFLRGGSVADAALLDFGIAQLDAATRPLTATGVIVGTPAYMAPEQARADKELGPAADVFSLGCILHECAAGTPPFSGGNLVAVLAKILFADPPRLRDVRPDIPDAVDVLLSRMLSRNPADRLPHGSAVAAAIASIDLTVIDPLGHTHVDVKKASEPVDDERVLTSVLVASPPSGPSGAVRSVADGTTNARLLELSHQLTKFGARAEIMADGSLVAAFVHTRGAATDQAALAARAALLLKSLWPEASIAVCTGRGRVHGALPIGEVLDRAAMLLHHPGHSNSSEHILLDDVTRGLLDARFRVHEMASGTYALTSEDSTLDPSRPLLGKPTPCVGRESELGVLDLALTSAIEEASPRAVLVIAPPGTGKSRLRHEFIRRAESRDDPPLVLLGQGDPMSAGSPYGIVGQALRRCAGIAEGEELSVRQSKLARRIAKNVPSDELRVASFLGEMCGIPFSDDNLKLRAARQDPVAMADQITMAFLDFLRAECDAAPVMLVLEDLHWGDSLTVKLVEAALRELNEQRLLVLALARPEVNEVFPKLWNNRAQVVVLRPLSRKAGERLVRQVLGTDVATDVVLRIVSQSEGNALFLEELIRSVAEGHGDEAPATVLAMLQARIGRLGPHTRRVLRCASIFGETSWLGGMRTLFGATLPHSGLDDALRSLVAAEILELRRESRFPQEPEYRFRHALTRDAAYGLLTEDDRVQGHRLAGEYLEAMHEQDTLVIAEHFVQGKHPARAVVHFARAAEQSCDNGDAEATISIAERGLALDPDPTSRGALLAAKADAYVWREQYADVLQIGTEAIELLEVGSKRWCHLLQQLLPAAALTGKQELVFELGTRLAGANPHSDAASHYVAAMCWLSISCGIMGQRAACEAFLGRAEQIIRTLPASERRAAAYYESARGNHAHLIEEAPYTCFLRNRESLDACKDAGLTRVAILSAVYHAKALMDLGEITQAEVLLRENLAAAERCNEAMSWAYARLYLARLLACHGPLESLHEPLALAEQVIATKTNHLRVWHTGSLRTLHDGATTSWPLKMQRAKRWKQPTPSRRIRGISSRSSSRFCSKPIAQPRH
ncbi:MAG: protein kinase [Polyangiaceae bacterium]|nr:protein kinase [Polyangiaceae bacterium]